MTNTERVRIVTADYDRLASFAERRGDHLAVLDMALLGPAIARGLKAETERLNDDLASAWLYLDHIGGQAVVDVADNPPPLRFLTPTRRSSGMDQMVAPGR